MKLCVICDYIGDSTPGGTTFRDDFTSAWPGIVRSCMLFYFASDRGLNISDAYGKWWDTKDVRRGL